MDFGINIKNNDGDTIVDTSNGVFGVNQIYNYEDVSSKIDFDIDPTPYPPLIFVKASASYYITTNGALNLKDSNHTIP